ncbi:MAG: poly(3-hydroxyalkanoate) depolymerase [Alphaproteobacteria bacterium]|jgi:poly(hydroxyalkanoate) depolymerase family esterase|nr:poly(3-hydroxyalkanoate) depolymerase [Alphaproteobacteria bacterium]
MWRKLVKLMRFDGPGGKPNPLKRRVAPVATPLAETAFSPNPGNLRMFSFVPAKPKGAPLVVLLHGCGQTAAGYDLGAGWSQLGADKGFAVLAVEQKGVNNPGTCFNWFNPEDVTRDSGEVASIAAMIVQMVGAHGLDPKRVFITGLSAGGAMTAAMLATYPEIFAGGAIIAGLPFGAAANVGEALGAMRAAPLKTPHQWGDLVRAASSHAGAWPRISIWHGGMDATVNVGNAQAAAAQWADVHGLKLTEAKQQAIGTAMRLSWGDTLEVITIPAMGHGTPIDSDAVGAPAPYILEAGISSTMGIADFWGLLETAKAAPKPAPIHIVPPPEPALPKIEQAFKGKAAPQPAPLNARVDAIIRRALKAAGLIKKR